MALYLPIEMPDCCAACPLMRRRGDNAIFAQYTCLKLPGYVYIVEAQSGRRAGCPLRDAPEMIPLAAVSAAIHDWVVAGEASLPNNAALLRERVLKLKEGRT